MLGAIIGDVIGSVYEQENIRTKEFNLYNDKCHYTDDTVLTIACADILLKNKALDEVYITQTFKKFVKKYPNCLYGKRFLSWVNSDNNEPSDSFGNGAVMRISPVGFLSKSIEEVEKFSRCITMVSHNTKQALIGSKVVSMCIYYAKHGKTKEFIKDYASKYYNLNYNYEELVKNNTFDSLCERTVPLAIYCFLISTDFEDCLRTTISIGGDTDTLCAVSCALSESYYKYIPEKVKQFVLDRLPEEFIKIIMRMYNNDKNMQELIEKLFANVIENIKRSDIVDSALTEIIDINPYIYCYLTNCGDVKVIAINESSAIYAKDIVNKYSKIIAEKGYLSYIYESFERIKAFDKLFILSKLEYKILFYIASRNGLCTQEEIYNKFTNDEMKIAIDDLYNKMYLLSNNDKLQLTKMFDCLLRIADETD